MQNSVLYLLLFRKYVSETSLFWIIILEDKEDMSMESLEVLSKFSVTIKADMKE